MKKYNKGFSLTELIIFIAISTFLILSILSITYYLLNEYNRMKERSESIRELSNFFSLIEYDFLNVAVYPRRPAEMYQFSSDHIVFYSNGEKIEYHYSPKEGFRRVVGTTEFVAKYIRGYSITYYTIDGSTPHEDERPLYCIMQFECAGQKKVSMRMRL